MDEMVRVGLGFDELLDFWRETRVNKLRSRILILTFESSSPKF